MQVRGDSQRLSSALSSTPRSAQQRELGAVMAQRMQGMSMGSDGQSGQASPTGSCEVFLGTAEDRQLRFQLRTMFKCVVYPSWHSFLLCAWGLAQDTIMPLCMHCRIDWARYAGRSSPLVCDSCLHAGTR